MIVAIFVNSMIDGQFCINKVDNNNKMIGSNV